MLSLLLVLFLPTILMLVSLPLWLIKKLSSDAIKYIMFTLYFGYIFILAITLETQSIFETILYCGITLVANIKQLNIYVNKLYSFRNTTKKSEYEDQVSYNYEPSDEDKLIKVVRECLGSASKPYSGHVFMSDDIRDLGLVKHYDEFKDAINKEFHVNLYWDTFSDFQNLEDLLNYIKDHRYDSYD